MFCFCVQSGGEEEGQPGGDGAGDAETENAYMDVGVPAGSPTPVRHVTESFPLLVCSLSTLNISHCNTDV